jgi:hypothetical protein
MYSALASEMGVADLFTELVNSGILNADSITLNLGLLLSYSKPGCNGHPSADREFGSRSSVPPR